MVGYPDKLMFSGVSLTVKSILAMTTSTAPIVSSSCAHVGGKERESMQGTGKPEPFANQLVLASCSSRTRGRTRTSLVVLTTIEWKELPVTTLTAWAMCSGKSGSLLM